MSSHSGWACFDLLPERGTEEFLQAVHGLPEKDDEVAAVVEGRRVFLLWARSPIPLITGGQRLVPGAAGRALMALDWDEYGVQHRVLGANGKPVHKACVDERGAGWVRTPTRWAAAAEPSACGSPLRRRLPHG